MKKLSDLIEKINDTPPLSFEKFTALNTAPKTEPWESMRSYYSHESIGVRAFGIIMNGVLTNKKKTFLLSYRIFNKWLEQNGESHVSGKTYKKILAQLTDTKIGFMSCVSKSSAQGSNEHRAGKYEITLPMLLKYLD